MKQKKIKWIYPEYDYREHDRGDSSVYVNGLQDLATVLKAINENITLLGQLVEASLPQPKPKKK